MTPDGMLSTKRVAYILGVSCKTARKYIRSGAIKSCRVGRQYRVKIRDVEDFFLTHEVRIDRKYCRKTIRKKVETNGS